MIACVRNCLKLCLLFACACAGTAPRASDDPPIDTGAGNLLVVLRESRGSNKQDETLRPFGKMRGVIAGRPGGRPGHQLVQISR